jgi:hypothetical protein
VVEPSHGLLEQVPHLPVQEDHQQYNAHSNGGGVFKKSLKIITIYVNAKNKAKQGYF